MALAEHPEQLDGLLATLVSYLEAQHVPPAAQRQQHGSLAVAVADCSSKFAKIGVVDQNPGWSTEIRRRRYTPMPRRRS